MAEDQPDDLPDPDDCTDPSPNPGSDSELAVLCDLLQERGVTLVAVHYEGCGDSGAAESVEYLPITVELPKELEDALRNLAENYCPEGYENDDGGYGTLTVYPFLGVAELEHRERCEGTETMNAASPSLPEELRQRLARAGITSLTARFDGCGDSGQFEEWAAEPTEVELPVDRADEIENFLLEQLPGGWEINEGSSGTFTVDVASGEVELDAFWRVAQDSAPECTRWKWRK